MAILDMFNRPIEKGDVIVFTSGAVRAFNIAELEEGSLLGPTTQIPVGKMRVASAFEIPLANPQRTQNLRLTDVCIVMKGVDLPSAEKQ